MEIYDVFLPELNNTFSVLVERKKIKTCRLKVFPDKSIKFSVPESTPREWINEYLCSKTHWISSKMLVFEQTKGYAATNEIRDGISIRYLGEDLIFCVSQSNRNVIYKEGKFLHICTTDFNNRVSISTQFDKWWRDEALKVLDTLLDELYPIIKKYKIDKPKALIRKMKTKWGSCSPQRGIITFNQYLTKATPACIEYVVLHELIHFLYPNHSKQFYDFLSNYMPDWKSRKKTLDQDVVHGL